MAITLDEARVAGKLAYLGIFKSSNVQTKIFEAVPEADGHDSVGRFAADVSDASQTPLKAAISTFAVAMFPLLLAGRDERQAALLFPGLTWERLENLYINRNDHPMQRRSGEKVGSRLNPVRIIESPSHNHTCAGIPLRRTRHSRSATSAKL
jgi:hypothetical protein